MRGPPVAAIMVAIAIVTLTVLYLFSAFRRYVLKQGRPDVSAGGMGHLRFMVGGIILMGIWSVAVVRLINADTAKQGPDIPGQQKEP